MATKRQKILSGADIELIIGGKKFPQALNIDYIVDYGEKPVYGIDTPFAQEIIPTQVRVKGTITGIVFRGYKGIQSNLIRSRVQQILSAYYVSIRIVDKSTKQDLLWIPQAKIITENWSIGQKKRTSLTFTFQGIIPYSYTDRQTK